MTENDNDNIGTVLENLEHNARSVITLLMQAGEAVDKDNMNLTLNLVHLLEGRIGDLRTAKGKMDDCKHERLDINYIWQANMGKRIIYKVREVNEGNVYEIEQQFEDREGSTESLEQWTCKCLDCGQTLFDKQGPNRIPWNSAPKEIHTLLDEMLENFWADASGEP